MIVNVNPASVRTGDKLVLSSKLVFNVDTEQTTEVATKTHTVKRVGQCGKLECIHIDEACYDTRFSTVRVSR